MVWQCHFSFLLRVTWILTGCTCCCSRGWYGLIKYRLHNEGTASVSFFPPLRLVIHINRESVHAHKYSTVICINKPKNDCLFFLANYRTILLDPGDCVGDCTFEDVLMVYVSYSFSMNDANCFLYSELADGSLSMESYDLMSPVFGYTTINIQCVELMLTGQNTTSKNLNGPSFITLFASFRCKYSKKWDDRCA